MAVLNNGQTIGHVLEFLSQLIFFFEIRRHVIDQGNRRVYEFTFKSVNENSTIK